MTLRFKRKATGFTLLEVLIALGIVAVVAILSWQGLQEVLRMRDRLNEVDERLLVSMAIFNQMQSDIGEMERGTQKGQTQMDNLSIVNEGLLIYHTERKADRPTVQRQTLWTLQGNQLFRISRPTEQPEAETRTEGLPVQGMRLRAWVEGTGWTEEKTMGTVNLVGHATPVYKGRANPVGNDAPPQAGQDQAATSGQRIVRAVEVTITQSNGQSLVRILDVGGEY